LFHLVLESHDGRAPGADSEEKHEPVSDIDTVVVDSLKVLDPKLPIREADIRVWLLIVSAIENIDHFLITTSIESRCRY
jgi:hypothetical protein